MATKAQTQQTPQQPTTPREQAAQVSAQVDAAITAALSAAVAAAGGFAALAVAGYTLSSLRSAVVAFLRPLTTARVYFVGRLLQQSYTDALPTGVAPVASVVDEVFERERQYELLFVERSTKRIIRSLERSAERGDTPQERREVLRKSFERELRFNKMRQAAIERRVRQGLEEVWVRAASPSGAYWKLDPSKKTHTKDCLVMAGKAWSWAVLADIRPSNRHNTCFVSGTMVGSPSPVLATTSRWYSGEIIKIRTPLGGDLSVTPNHPILTRLGWVAAGLLDESDDLVYATGGQSSILLNNPHNQEFPARIENVRATSAGLLGMVSASVPLTAMDFHGDVIEGQVAVVSTNGSLVADVEPSLLEILGNVPFDVRDPMVRIVLSSLCCSHASFMAARASASSLIGALNLLLALYVGEIVHDELSSLTGISQGYAGAFETARDRTARDVELNRELLDRRSAKVLLDDLVDGKLSTYKSKRIVRIERWHGHVHNLHTQDGWYLAEGIIAHNCGCQLLPLQLAQANGLPNANMIHSRAPRVARDH